MLLEYAAFCCAPFDRELLLCLVSLFLLFFGVGQQWLVLFRVGVTAYLWHSVVLYSVQFWLVLRVLCKLDF